MKTKKFKLGRDQIEFSPDDYTENEVNVRISNSGYAVTTTITKPALVRFGEELALGNAYVMANESDYESFPLFSATKGRFGYSFLVKNFISISIELPFDVAKEIADYLKQIEP